MPYVAQLHDGAVGGYYEFWEGEFAIRVNRQVHPARCASRSCAAAAAARQEGGVGRSTCSTLQF